MMTEQHPMDKGEVYTLRLTAEQRAAIQESTGETGDTLWLTIGEIEERISQATSDQVFHSL